MTAARTRYIAVMDTTLRDGEQTPNVAYTPIEKLQIAKFLLGELGVDRAEIASTKVSRGELDGARLITKWAQEMGYLDRVEILGFCDGDRSVDWITDAGGKVINLLTKGSERHCRTQLRMSPEEHLARIAETIEHAKRAQMIVNVYLEDWSNGVRESLSYVSNIVELLERCEVARVFLPDTLGRLSPIEVSSYVNLMCTRWPTLTFEFHGHNDYGLGTANGLAAAYAGAMGVHCSINGMGERAGNASLAELVVALHDHTPFRTHVDEARLAQAALLIEACSGKEIAANTPIVGRDVFTQTAGIHADGDAKGDLYVSRLAAPRFGRQRTYALGKMSGKASLEHNLTVLGIELSEPVKQLVLKRITELGDKKHIVASDDLPHIIADVLEAVPTKKATIDHYQVTVGKSQVPAAEITVTYRGKTVKAQASGAGGYDAIMNALGAAGAQFDFKIPTLVDFRVRIPPGGRTEALVETRITWRPVGSDDERETFSTVGVDRDQIAAAVIATEKMLNKEVDGL